MADWLIRHIPQTTEQFLLRSDASGVEAKIIMENRHVPTR